MKKVITSERIPIKLWLDDIEEGALQQARNLANLPFAFHHIAIMPDSHEGYGMPIGGVLASKNTIIPNAVGVDIGCGMCAIKSSLTDITTENLKKIMGEIRKQIPVGFNHHTEKQNKELMPDYYQEFRISDSVIDREYEKALYSLGSLGGGNHFIEIQKGSDNFIWIMIHSGSRNLGKQVADHYNNIAKELNKKWYSAIPENYDLAFLSLDSNEGQAYQTEMKFCMEYALANRKLMMDRIITIFVNKFNCTFEEMINIAHNYAVIENHFNHNVVVHRKGATLARNDTVGIIPGSQGTKSYIVKGKGNPESFMSCSHGAGRVLSRKKAQNTLNLQDEIKKLDDKGIIHSIRNQTDLDEAPGSYKDIKIVMENQNDLVDILVELTPLGVIKG